jgi:hypothetical protein
MVAKDDKVFSRLYAMRDGKGTREGEGAIMGPEGLEVAGVVVGAQRYFV